ncbi:FAD-dependent monooxygenase [Halanaeroarchaeum sulfurireducens]|uniref:FAD-dependent oxidoreductase n=1 Tax=Halanaeroarchaeum sulfurireducens TaxID=1604004 RepID=A0A0F7PG11_9EURY|nr:FAD-dependent monooxygenase [Halanaeroarchaeum sulfurireducens]AKH98509.1 FAD-dependent oxidoreductase [Halanaeroarchaeum sulfurireducens]
MTETPNYDNEYDAIVVGAGPAGSAAALTMAQRDLDVIMIERGSYPGAKNVFGGILFTPTIRELVDDFSEAPTERYIAEKKFSMLSNEDETALSMKPGAWHEEPHNDSYTILRGDFDEWFAEQAVEAGATLVTETTVLDVVREGDDENGQIVGVETDRPDGQLLAPMVVLAEGANSLVSEDAGLKETSDAQDVAVAAKEVRKYDRDTIEERFNLHDEDGVAYHYFGEGAIPEGFGGAYIYSNKRTISIGLAYSIKDARESQKKPDEILNDFKEHPAVAPLVRGGQLVEYSAHAIPEGGYDDVPDLVHDGAVLVGDTASLVLNNGVHLEGTNMAAESGYHAGKAIANALDQGRTEASALSQYPEDLENSFVLDNLEHYNWFHDLMEQEEDFLFKELPTAIADAEKEYFRMDKEPKESHAKSAKSIVLQAAGGYIGAAKRAWKFRRFLS